MALAVDILTDLASQWFSRGDRRAKKQLEDEAMAIYGDASPPTLERMLQERLGPSAMEALPKDFGNKGNRNTALQQIINMGLQGGNDEQSRLAMEEARRAGAAQAAGASGAVLQSMQRRGLGGAGAASAALQSQQAAGDRAALADMQAAGDSRSRALQALATGGGLAAQAEGQDFEQAARRAESMDAFARFNSELATNAIQQEWSNRIGLMDRQYNAKQNRAQQYGQSADATRRRVGAYGQSINDGLSSAYSAMGGMGGAPGQTSVQGGQVLNPNDPRYRRPM